MQQMPPDLAEFCSDFNQKHKSLRFYLRDRKGRLTGMLLAYRDGKHVKLGWSKCKIKEDTFRKDFALYVAARRAATRTKKSLSIRKTPSLEDRKSVV